MKQIFISLVLVASLVTTQQLFINAGKIPAADPTQAAATAEQVDGLYIFYRCKPVADFESLGSVKPGMTIHGNASEQINGLVKNARKKFPAGDALLIGDADMNSADVIKFK